MNTTEIIRLDFYEIRNEPTGRVVFFEAVIDDVVQTSPATRYDPAEYGSALCTGELPLEDDEPTPQNFDEALCYAQTLDIWTPVIDRW